MYIIFIDEKGTQKDIKSEDLHILIRFFTRKYFEIKDREIKNAKKK